MAQIQEKLIDVIVKAPSYTDFFGKTHRRNSICKVPPHWVELGTTRGMRGGKSYIIDRVIVPADEERAKLVEQQSLPQDTQAFDGEVARRESWKKRSETADKMNRDFAIEAALEAQRRLGVAVTEKKAG